MGTCSTQKNQGAHHMSFVTYSSKGVWSVLMSSCFYLRDVIIGLDIANRKARRVDRTVAIASAKYYGISVPHKRVKILTKALLSFLVESLWSPAETLSHKHHFRVICATAAHKQLAAAWTTRGFPWNAEHAKLLLEMICAARKEETEKWGGGCHMNIMWAFGSNMREGKRGISTAGTGQGSGEGL